MSWRSLCGRLALAVVLLGAASSRAGDGFWSNPNGGNFTTTANWDNNTPPTSDGSGYFCTFAPTAYQTFTVTLTNNSSTIGYLWFGAGNVTFDFSNHTLNVTNGFNLGTVAGNPNPLLMQWTIKNGTVAVGGTGYVGNNSNMTGVLTIDTGGVLSGSSNLYVGAATANTSAGTLSVINGGRAAANIAYVGAASGANGTLAVSSANSTFTVNNLYVGSLGSVGNAYAQSGGSVTVNGDTTVAGNSGGLGTVSLYDATTTWTTNNLYVGGTSTAAGGTGNLNVSGGTFTVANTLLDWTATGAVSLTGGTLNVKTFDRRGGFSFTGGTLNVSGSGAAFINNNAPLTVSGPGSPAFDLQSGATTSGITSFTVANSGFGSALVSGGSVLTTQTATVGSQTGSSGSVVVANANSKWDTGLSSLTVGGSGTGFVTVQSGGTLTTQVTTLGSAANSSGSLTVDGVGSSVLTTGVQVGVGGAGSLIVRNGGSLNTFLGTLDIAANAGSTGSVTVGGSGASALTIGNALSVGGTSSAAGGTGSLTVNSGTAGAGPLTVWPSGTVAVNGGTLTTGAFNRKAGSAVNLNGGTLAITGAWNNTNADFTVSGSGSGNATLSLTGSATVGNNLNILYVGSGGTSNGVLNLLGGAKLTATEVDLAYSPVVGTTTMTATATIDGPGSQLTVGPSLLRVGYSGSAILNVTHGGTLTTPGQVSIGRDAGSQGTLTVQDASSSWASSGGVNLGLNSLGLVQIRSGGSATFSGYLQLGNNSTGTGNGTLLVDGGTVSVTATSLDPFSVGYYGTGVLTLQNAGTLSVTANASVGQFAGATGTATVTGSASRWSVGGGLYLGGSATAAGGTGSLTASGNGIVAVTGKLKLWGSDDSVTATGGGQITAGSLESPSGSAAHVYITDPAGGTALTVGSDNTSTSFFGTIVDGPNGPGGLKKVGTGTLTLIGRSTYSGTTAVSGGNLTVAGGAMTGPAVVTNGATLRYTGGTIAPGFNGLTAGTDSTGGTIVYDSTTVTGGFLRGTGTHQLAGTNPRLNGTTVLNGVTVQQTVAATFTDVTFGGTMTASSTANTPLTWDGGSIASSGLVTIPSGATVNVNNIVNNGQLNINKGGTLNVTGGSLVLGGGSTTILGDTPGTGGVLNVGSQPLYVRGGLLLNHGAVGNSTGNGYVYVDYGGYAKGNGAYWDIAPIVIPGHGGQYTPGDSPGRATSGTFIMNGGSTYNFQINDAGPSAAHPGAPGVAGPTPDATGQVRGWSLSVVRNQFNPALSALVVTATPQNPFTINLITLQPPTPPDTAGPMDNFDPTQPYRWLAFDVDTQGQVTGWDPNAIRVDTTQMKNTVNGTFALVRDQANPFQFYMTYTPVPEPGSILLAGAAAAAAAGLWRRRRAVRRAAGPPPAGR